MSLFSRKDTITENNPEVPKIINDLLSINNRSIRIRNNEKPDKSAQAVKLHSKGLARKEFYCLCTFFTMQHEKIGEEFMKTAPLLSLYLQMSMPN